MEQIISATELSKHLSDILHRVRSRGDRFTVASNGEPVAVLAPVGASPWVTLRQLAEEIGELRLPDEGSADDVAAQRGTR
jgi:prevent-host-death family protein